MEKFGISLCVTLIMLDCAAVSKRQSNSNKIFKMGLYKIGNLNKSVERIKMLKEVGQSYPEWQRRCFVLSLRRMFNHPDYNHQRMLDKLQLLSKKVVNCPDTNTYLMMMENVYNYKQSAETKLRFL